MINSIRFIDGFPVDLECVGRKVFNFKPGINVLYGPNGCGKSTILKTLKAYSGIANKGGWTHFNDPLSLASNSFPLAYMGITPSKCTAQVSWDGTPSFFNDGDIKTNEVFFYHNAQHSDDGITSEQEQLIELAEKPSSGQYRINKVNKVFNTIRNVPSLQLGDGPSGYSRSVELELKYWNSLPKTGPQTILLDEPERALSLTLQKKLILEIIPQFKDLQIIMATHSIFALLLKDINIIDMQPGYIEECKKVLKETSFE